jgi:hypothetical protein
MPLHFKKPLLLAAVISAAILSTACSQTAVKADNSGYQQAQQDFNHCKIQALQLDASAGREGLPAQYYQSASVAQSCETELGDYINAVSLTPRMQIQALSVQNFVKAGELEQATNQLAEFQMLFPNQDLFFSDSTSFVDTYRLLLGEESRKQAARNSLLNAKAELKAELRRNDYWKTH